MEKNETELIWLFQVILEETFSCLKAVSLIGVHGKCPKISNLGLNFAFYAIVSC